MQLPGKHRFPIEKYAMVKEILVKEQDLEVLDGPLATLSETELVHDAAYVQSISSGSASEQTRKRVGFSEAPMLPYVLRSFASVGATLAATRHADVWGLHSQQNQLRRSALGVRLLMANGCHDK
eukprot:4628743-Amphidinium_carterae.1